MTELKIDVERFEFEKDSTRSRLSINGILDGYAVEDEIRAVKIHGETAIPNGTYKLGVRQSPKFSSSFLWSESLKVLIEPKEKTKYPKAADFVPHELIWAMNVPNFEYVLIHWGNTDDNTDGCLIVGKALGVVNGQPGVIDSRNYYKKLYAKIYPIVKKQGGTITYRNKFNN